MNLTAAMLAGLRSLATISGLGPESLDPDSAGAARKPLEQSNPRPLPEEDSNLHLGDQSPSSCP